MSIGIILEIVDEKSGGGNPSCRGFLTQGVRKIRPMPAKNKMRGANAHKFVPDSTKAQATVSRKNIPYIKSARCLLFHKK